jgi:hypothetical protein
MQNSRKYIYWNPKQIAFLNAQQRFKTFLGGRGSGKSTVIAGETRLRMQEMPRAKFFLSSTTYNQILTKTLPAIEAKLMEMGFEENVHYVVGKRPLPSFALPYQPPRKYENTMSFFNGYCIEFLSLDRPDLARGGSYQGGDIDEAALVQKEHFTKVLLPSVRGFRHRFTSHRFGQVNKYTSIPWKPSGYWILEDEQKALSEPHKYLWLESTAWDNVEVLGEEFIRDLERELPYLEYLVEVMNQRIRKTDLAFYHRFDPDRHSYSVKYLYGQGERGVLTAGIRDQHYRYNELLDISFDFSGWFNCATVWQQGRIDKSAAEFCLSQFYVKEDEGRIAELVDKICAHYKGHEFRLARLWGEPRGHDKKADTRESIYDQIASRFQKNGWKTEIRVSAGQVKKHKERNYLMNSILAEDNPKMPLIRFNQETCKDAIIAMQVAEVKDDFQKNKSKEKDRAYPQEHATHFTDTIDYYFSQKHGWKVNSNQNRGPMDATFR